jgi:acetate kinase
LEPDETANRRNVSRIGTDASRVAAYVIASDENEIIARHT